MNQSQSPPTQDSLSRVVIETVAEEMDTDPDHLPELLHEVIDPDALDALFAGQNSPDGAVMFSYCGYDVTVRANGNVTLEE